MYRKKLAVCLIATTISLLGITGCSLNNNVPTETTVETVASGDITFVPTENQKIAIEALGWDASNLEPYQLTGLAAIEDMWNYMNQNYDDKFIFAGYENVVYYNQEQMSLYIEGNEEIPVVITRSVDSNSNSYVYSSTYAEVKLTPVYEADLKRSLQLYLKSDSTYKIFSQIDKITSQSDENKLLSTAEAKSIVFLNEQDYSKEDLELMASEFTSGMELINNGTPSSTYFFLLPEDKFSEATRGNAETIVENKEYLTGAVSYVQEAVGKGVARMAIIE